MWCGDWSELPQDSIRILGAQKGPVQEQDAKSLLYTLGSHKDRNSHLVRLACLGPYLFGSTFFSKDCEVWARSSGLYFGPSKLVDSNMSAEVREAIMVLDTLAYHISFVLVIWNMSECTPSTTLLMAEKHKTFLTDFDKEAHYSTVRKMVEASDFFRLFRKKLTTSLGEEQILACFMIALKVSLAHCHGALDTMLTYIRWDSQQNLQGSRADELKQCGNRKYKEKAYQEAFVYYTNAIEYMCYSHILYSNRALSALQLQKFKEVELDARRAVILQPNFEKGYFEMAQVYASTEQISRAEKVLEDYIKRCDLMSLKFSRDIQDLLNKLRETGEKTKNGKADTKDNQPASGKPKAKPAVPDLVSDSDSDEATPPPKQSKPPTNQKKRTPFDTDKEMKDILKKSCEDLVGGLYQVALQGFKKVLSQKPNLTELDVVLVEYAAGCALLGMGSLEDLKNSVEYFLGIVSNHKDIVFPLAYYGVSRALIKMNRFSEALPHIEKCLSILQKGIQFSEALLWPETKTKVDNAKRPQLQKAMEEMQVLCRAPPKWDAMCCYEACPLQKSIYYSDPDFKGFQQVHCASKCLVQYHPACWREYRESRNLTEKGFLGEACPTPDCCSAVVKVEAIEKDGTVGKQFVHNQLLVETAPKQKKTKKEKKLEQREQKKQQRRAADPGTKQPTNDKDEDAALLQSSASCESTGAAVEDMLKEPSVERAKPPKVQPKPPSEQAAPATSEQAEAADPVQRDAQYVLKKDEDIDEDIQVDGRAKKWKRKKNKPIRVLELEPSDNLYSEYQERIRRLAEYKNLVEEHGYWKDFCHKQKDMIPELDPENPFYIPEGLRRNEAALEAVLQHHGGDHTEESSDINETIYQLFEDLIESKGPLSIHDKLLASEVMNFPEPAQRTVARGGGLQSFLLRSLRFTFDGDMVYTMRMRPWRPSSHKSDEISLPDDGSDYEDDDEFVESDEEEERGAEVANEYDSSRYIETMRQVNSTPSASVASGDSTPNPSTALMKAIANCNLNPNATAFELPLDNLATGSQSGDAQLPSSSTIEKRALPSAAATATRTDTGREVVVQKILSELPPKQLGESLILAVNSFRGPLSSETLASINSGLEHCKLCNKTGMQDLCVQVDQSAEYLEERDALLERCEMLTYENARIKEQYESALDCNMQTNSKHTVETSKYKEKIEELNKELQASRQAAKKNKLESDAEIKKLQQERVKLKEENKLLKTSRNEDDIKETLEKTITEFTKMKSKCDELEETCMALEEASDRALERAKRAEIRILETAHKWGLERFEQSKKLVQKVLKEMEGLKASLDPNSLAELVRKERLADLYMKEWKKEYEQFQRKVQDHIEKVEKGQALADLEVIDLPAKPDFEIPLPKPSVLPLSRLQAPRPQSPRPQTPRPTFPPQQDISMAVKPRMPSFPAQAPLFSHPSGVMLPFTVPAPGPKALPPGLDIPAGAQALSSSATAKPVNIAAIGTPAGPGVTYYFATSAPMPTGNGEVALGAATPARTSPGYPTAASRPAEKAVNEAPGQLHRSEKLMQKLMEKHPGVPREEIRAVLKRIYQTKGFKGLTIADIIKETSVVLHNTFPHAQAASIEGREEHKLPARAPQQPKPRPVLTALRPSQSAVLQPQRPLPVAPPPKTWTSQHEAGQTWSGRSTQCSICLEDLNADRQEIRALRCRHCFHEQCLKEWFKTERTCPNCRSYTLTDSEFPTLGS